MSAAKPTAAPTRRTARPVRIVLRFMFPPSFFAAILYAPPGLVEDGSMELPAPTRVFSFRNQQGEAPMTRRTNARVAGFAFLFYIAVAMTGMILSTRATSGEGTAAKLANIAQHATSVRVAVVLELLGCFS